MSLLPIFSTECSNPDFIPGRFLSIIKERSIIRSARDTGHRFFISKLFIVITIFTTADTIVTVNAYPNIMVILASFRLTLEDVISSLSDVVNPEFVSIEVT